MNDIKRILNFFDIAMNYLTLQLVRCAVFSLIAMALIFFLRKLFRKRIFLKNMLWLLLLPTLFLGKLKGYYNINISNLWTELCMNNLWISRVYFIGMTAVFIHVLHRRIKLRKFIKNMPSKIISDEKVYISNLSVTPFTAGVLSLKIVLPEIMVKEYSEDEIKTILLHERTHIKLCHLLYYALWDIFHILFWINPLFIFWGKYFKSDCEDVCDIVTIQKSGGLSYEYGSILIRSLQILKNNTPKVPFAFAAESQYTQIKERIIKISEYRKYKKKIMILMLSAFAALLFLLMIVIGTNSYPRYSEISQIDVYSLTADKILISDCADLRNAIEYDTDFIYIDSEKFKLLLNEYNISDNEYFITFGGYSKLQGYGGGGYCIYMDNSMIESGISKIPYDDSMDILSLIFKNI